jgi:nitroreductase
MNKDIIHNKVVDTIIERRTIREYSPKQITDKELDTLLNAALWAPSGRNSQPVHVRVLQDTDALILLNEDFKNLVGWDTPAYTRYETNPVYHNAPTMFFLFSDRECHMDAGLMTENICIAAEGIGLGTCIIASVGALMNAPEGNIWKQRLNVPEDWYFLIAIAVGYKAEDPPPKPRDESRFQVIKKI